MRRYDDPVDVRRRDDVPAEFLWHGRLYIVRDVLAHWVETGAWWRAPAADAVYGRGADHGSGSDGSDSAGRSGEFGESGKSGESGGSGVPSSMALDQGGDRDMWRVEASAGRARGTGVFDLCFEWSAGAWRLARALD